MIELRPYQNKLIQRAREAYTQGYNAPCIVAPCGAGKSVIIASIAKTATEKGSHVMFIVHRKELKDQIKGTFDFVGVDTSKVYFGMVQTVVNRLDKLQKPDLIIIDENHHVLSNSYRKILDYYSDVPKLGFTATPIRLNGSGLGDVNDVLIEEVDAEWLIAHHYLSPYRYYAPKLIDDFELKLSSTRDFTNKSMDKALSNTIHGDVIKHYRELADGEKAIAYCHNVEASKQTAQAFNDAGIPAKHIDGKTPRLERDQAMQDFRDGKITVLTNCDLLGEGVDVPDCSTVIMLRPTQSLSLYIQQSMRGMRYQKGKTSIIIDHVGNVNRHGLPDMKREWSLNGRKKAQEAETSIRECLNCFAAYDPKTHEKCPLCGFKPEVEEKETEIQVDTDAELEEVNKESFTLSFKEPEECETYEELKALAKARGYKASWAAIQAARRGLPGPAWARKFKK